MYDDDYDEKRKLKLGVVYKAKITQARNVDFHRKYFKLIRCAWECQNEKTIDFFHNNFDSFRKTVEISAGICERVYSIARKEWLDIPKSIAFDKMDNIEFEELYERVKDVLFSIFLKNIDKEEFITNLMKF